MRIIQPPERITPEYWYKHSVFLAGSIEMGSAENWQDQIIKTLEGTSDFNNYVIYNPRRDDWDSSWKQEATNPHFSQQVNWELDALGSVQDVVMYFSPGTISPISLLELGLFGSKMIVVCPEGYYRKGNVDIVCDRYEIPQEDTVHNAFLAIHQQKYKRK